MANSVRVWYFHLVVRRIGGYNSTRVHTRTITVRYIQNRHAGTTHLISSVILETRTKPYFLHTHFLLNTLATTMVWENKELEFEQERLFQSDFET